MRFVNLSQDAHAESRSRERMPMHHLLRKPQLQPQLSYFVLEQFAQRLQQLELHVFRQAAHVVVRFDDMRLSRLGARRLNDVRIDRALREPLDVFEFRRLFIEHFDKTPADDFSLLLRIRFAGQRRQEALFGIDANDLHAHVLCERGHHLIAFTQTQQSMIDEYASQLRADGLMQQRGQDGRINPTRQSQQYPIAANLSANARDAVLDDVAGRPARGTTGDLTNEAAQNLAALQGMRHFGMKLQAV